MSHQELVASGTVQPRIEERVPMGVVVVNWNGATDTIDCLQSLLSCRPAPARVVVVDNASEDDSVERIKAFVEFQNVTQQAAFELGGVDGDVHCRPDLTLVESETNRGFAGGSNLGLANLARDSSIDHFLLLNNDATVADDYFAELRAALRAKPHAGLLSGTIYAEGDQQPVWYAGGVAKLRRALMLHANVLPPTGTPRETQYVSGCTMLLSRSLLETIGPLPECYFPGYWEDAEYSLRARAHGFPLVYAPAAVAHHRVGSSFGQPRVRPQVAYLQNRHRAMFVRRNLRGWIRLVALSYLFVTKPIRALVETVRGRPGLGFSIVAGMIAGALHDGRDRPER